MVQNLLTQSDHLLVMLTSSYISLSWRQHGWFVLELCQLPLDVAVYILQQAAWSAERGLAMSTSTAKGLCLAVEKQLDPVILSAMGAMLGSGQLSVQVRPGGCGSACMP